MVGDTVISDGVEFVVVWDGGEGLINDRLTKPSGIWSAPKRIYNKKSDFWVKPRKKQVDKVIETLEDV